MPTLHVVTLFLLQPQPQPRHPRATQLTPTNTTIDDRRHQTTPMPLAPTTVTSAHVRSQPFTSQWTMTTPTDNANDAYGRCQHQRMMPTPMTTPMDDANGRRQRPRTGMIPIPWYGIIPWPWYDPISMVWYHSMTLV